MSIKTYGDWRCTNCDNIEQKEREVRCWKCGKSEMVFTPFKPELVRPSVAERTEP
jgi:hypothetical protein